MADTKDFLNPNSMLTPGLAGGMTVSISMPIAISFDISVKWLALVVSFLIGVLIVYAIKERMSFLQRMGYCILNSLVIFSTALGAGIAMDPPPAPPDFSYEAVPLERSDRSGFSLSEFIGISSAAASSYIEIKRTENPADENGVTRTDAGEGRYSESVKQRKTLEPDTQDAEKRHSAYQRKLQLYRKRWSW